MSIFTITPSTTRHEIARSFYRDVISGFDNYFVFLGKTSAWGTPDNPEVPQDTRQYLADAHKNMLLLKKVVPGPNDVVYMAHRHDWEPNVIYAAYGDDVELYDRVAQRPINFYVMTDDYNIYKCLSNNDGAASTEKPTSTDPYGSALQVLSDGYVWKFMYQVPVLDRLRFLTAEYIPVRSAASFDVNGVLNSVVINNAGAGYVAPYAIIEGDGYKPSPIQVTGTNVNGEFPDAITYVGHYFETGDKVLYSKGAGVAFGGLTNNSIYYIIKVDANNFKVATSLANAHNNVAIAITPGTGATHRFILVGDETEIITDGFGSISEVKIVNSRRGYTTARITMYDADTAPLSGTTYEGTITATPSSKIVTGVGTAFTTQLSANRTLVNGNNDIVGIISQINSDTQLELVAPAAVAVNNASYGTFAGSGFEGVVMLEMETANPINENVVASSVHGAVFRVDVLNGGTEYSSSGTYITSIGDGQDLSVTPVVTGGVITQVIINNPGSGYNYVNLTASSTLGQSAEFLAHVGPQQGHGSNIPKELLATTICVASTINTDNVDLFANNDYRQIGLLKNPKVYSQTQDFDVGAFTENTGTACFVVEVPAAQYSSYGADDLLLASTGGRYRVITKRYDRAQNAYFVYMLYLEGSKTLTSAATLTNETNNALALTLLGIVPPEFDKNSGTIVYVQNAAPIARSDLQVETIKLLIHF